MRVQPWIHRVMGSVEVGRSHGRRGPNGWPVFHVERGPQRGPCMGTDQQALKRPK